MAKKTSPISIEITVDENKVPEKIVWSAPDGGVDKRGGSSHAFGPLGWTKSRDP